MYTRPGRAWKRGGALPPGSTQRRSLGPFSPTVGTPRSPVNTPRSGDGGPLTILGGGIFGSALAFHLAALGAARIRCLDWTDGHSGTSRSSGILTTVGWDPWDLALVRESAAELRALSDANGWGELRSDGGVRLARTEPDVTWLRAMERLHRGHGVPAQLLDRIAAEALLPALDLEGVRAALSTPDDATFSVGEVAVGYREAAERLGATFEPAAHPVRLHRRDDRWEARTESGTFESSRVVLAVGAWLKPLLDDLGAALPLAPFRTQAARLRTSPLSGPGPTIHDLDLEVYVRPDRLGRLLVGDGTERREADPATTVWDADPAFVAKAEEATKGLWGASTAPGVESAWAGLCVASPDRFPLVGRVPGAPGAFVATGFNGFGAMRAPALARALARGILLDEWSALAPADPARFSGPVAPFEPRPLFPLDREIDLGSPDVDSPPAAPSAGSHDFGTAPLETRPITSGDEVDSLELPPLSEWFDPFLRQFMRDALRTGGEVEVVVSAGRVAGVYLYSPAEGVASIFTRAGPVARRYLPGRHPGGIYTDRRWAPGGETIEIMAIDLTDWAPPGALRNPIRLATAAELPRVAAVMRELTGAVDQRWFATLPRPEELGFLCEIEGRIAGMSWATVVGTHARGHSFMVHPRYRGLGIGTDLLQARTLWLRQRGVRQIVSEIYAGNAASRIAAERSGMAVVGRMYHYRPAGARGPERVRSAAPRTSGRPSR